MLRPGLTHKSDLSSKAPSSSVLQKTRHCVVVQVVDEVPNACLVCCSQLICCERGQRGTCSPRTTAITVSGRAQGQLRLEEEVVEKKRDVNHIEQTEQDSVTEVTK